MVMGDGMTTYKPFLVAWNLTRQCNLNCGHCYIDAGGGCFPDSELSREEGFRLIDDIALVNPGTILVLTGGEPLLYKYTVDFAKYASIKGLMVVVGTNGLLLDDPMIKRFKEIGVCGVGISLDSLDPVKHDAFRGIPGSWDRAVDAMERCRRHGLQFQIHNSVTSFNWMDVSQIVEFANHHGARVVNFFFMVCTGRGEELTDITAQQYEEVLSTLVDLQDRYPGMMIRARCAPHFKRIAYQKNPQSPITKAEGYLGGGCLAGSHYCRIAPDGEITPCPYMPLSVGNIRANKFSDIWANASVFNELRSPQLKGKCGECEYEDLCGGCRARPYASHGDYLDEDLWCQYVPKGGKKIGASKMSDKIEIMWTEEAEDRLKRLPFFLREMIKGNTEKYAEDNGISLITPNLLDELRKKRFGDTMPEMPTPALSLPNDPLHWPSAAMGTPGGGNKGGGDLEQDIRSPFPWTKEAKRRLDTVPEFMVGMFREAVEEFARNRGHLEVNIDVWDRFEEVAGQKQEIRNEKLEVRNESGTEKGIKWTEDALQEIEYRYSNRPQFAKDFIVEIIKEDVENAARAQGITLVDKKVLETVDGQKKINAEWSEDAWKRLQKAPDFIRSGIKKAAERKASRLGIPVITSEHLTEFRNMAMMKAVKRIKVLGYTELTFDAFDYAKEKIKKIRESKEAQERLDEIREYVTSKGKVGLMDKDMLEKMKEYLKR